MRRLGQELGVDAMALYRYFPGKDALLSAAAVALYRGLAPSFDDRGSWKEKLLFLSEAYLHLIRPYPELLSYLLGNLEACSEPASLFATHFDDATHELSLSPKARGAALNALVDLIHGLALGYAYSGAPMRANQGRQRFGFSSRALD